MKVYIKPMKIRDYQKTDQTIEQIRERKTKDFKSRT